MESKIQIQKKEKEKFKFPKGIILPSIPKHDCESIEICYFAIIAFTTIIILEIILFLNLNFLFHF